MRKIILSAAAAVLIAGSATQAVATEPQHHAHRAAQANTGEHFRNARNAVEQPSQSFWPYAGWSAPAGR